MNKNAKIYIAGHNGLVGSAIWNNLTKKGYTNLIGRSSSEMDLRDQQAVKTFFAEQKPEYVVLAAAKVGGIMANSLYRADFIFENLQIQNNIIHQAYQCGVKKLLFLGSTCIYPRDAPQPMPEDCLLSGALEYTNEPYAIAKIAGLKMCESYNLQYGTNFIAVMPTNLYGPNDNFDLERSHVLPALLRKLYLGSCLEKNDWKAIRLDLTRRPIEGVDGDNEEKSIVEVLRKYGVKTDPLIGADQEDTDEDADSSLDNGAEGHKCVSVEIWGSGKPMREFLWSEEMADACVFVMEKVDFKDLMHDGRELTLTGKEIRNCHINIGTGKEISIKGLAELMSTIVGFEGKLVFNAEKPDGTLRKLTDASKLHSLGWHHQIEIEEGIKRLFEWYVRH